MFLETEVVIGFAGGCAVGVREWHRIRKHLHKGLPDWAT